MEEANKLQMPEETSKDSPEHVEAMVKKADEQANTKDINTGEGVVIVFPNGDSWVSEGKQDPFYNALEEEFKSLEEYLKSKGSTQIEKKQ